VIFSKLFLRRKFYRQHYLSIPVVIAGVTIVGVASFTHKGGRESSDTKWVGFVFVFITQVFGALFYISEEMLFKKYYLNPLKVAGWEGLWGVLIYAVVLIILQFINCEGSLCPQGHLDNSVETLRQLGDNYWLIIFMIGLLITHAMYNGFGVSVTKYASSAQRSTLNSCKTVVVWVFFLLFQGPGHEKFLWLQLVGFMLVIFGSLVFNEIIVFPFFGFSTNTKVKLEELSKLHDINYSETQRGHRDTKVMSCISTTSFDCYPSSPGAYDSSRGIRNIKEKINESRYSKVSTQ
jgi:hypothetical protein